MCIGWVQSFSLYIDDVIVQILHFYWFMESQVNVEKGDFKGVARAVSTCLVYVSEIL